VYRAAGSPVYTSIYRRVTAAADVAETAAGDDDDDSSWRCSAAQLACSPVHGYDTASTVHPS